MPFFYINISDTSKLEVLLWLSNTIKNKKNDQKQGQIKALVGPRHFLDFLNGHLSSFRPYAFAGLRNFAQSVVWVHSYKTFKRLFRRLVESSL